MSQLHEHKKTPIKILINIILKNLVQMLRTTLILNKYEIWTTGTNNQEFLKILTVFKTHFIYNLRW
jgi:hypothetical protein